MGNLAAVEGEKQVLAVYLGAQLFGIPIARIQGVLESQPLTYVPLAPAAIKGLMNLRGRIVTAIDLRSRLGAGEMQLGAAAPIMKAAGQNMNVVIENDGELYSFLVDRVVDVLSISCSKIEEPPLTMSASWRRVTSGVFQLQDKIMVILEPAALLTFEDD